MDYLESWKVSKSVEPDRHHPDCSTAQTEGTIMCDCEVLYLHPRHIGDYGETDITWDAIGDWVDGKWKLKNEK